jgi:flagellar basal-body rod protein FlgB
MPLFDNSIQALDQAIGAQGMRLQAINNNISNVNTPGYKRKDVEFDGMLREALESGDPNAVREIAPEVKADPNAVAMREDGNSVDIDQEMAFLAETNVRYNALIQMAAHKMKQLEYVISDGRR